MSPNAELKGHWLPQYRGKEVLKWMLGGVQENRIIRHSVNRSQPTGVHGSQGCTTLTGAYGSGGQRGSMTVVGALSPKYSLSVRDPILQKRELRHRSQGLT